MTMNGISEEKYTHIDEIKEQTKAVFDELMEQAKLEEGDILVVGCSSSEIASHRIGSYSSAEIGEAVAQTFLNCCKEKKIYLAAQCCEHLNRALTVERELAEKKDLEIVNVIPNLHAGGSGQVAAFKFMSDPVEVEEIVAHAGLDIGDTFIGMHVKRVQVPLISVQRELGGAHVTALTSRPKLIGGARATHTVDPIRKF